MDLLQQKVGVNLESMSENITQYFQEDIIADMIAIVDSKTPKHSEGIQLASIENFDKDNGNHKDKLHDNKKSTFGMNSNLKNIIGNKNVL